MIRSILPGETQQGDHWSPSISQQIKQPHIQIQRQLRLASIHDPTRKKS